MFLIPSIATLLFHQVQIARKVIQESKDSDQIFY